MTEIGSTKRCQSCFYLGHVHDRCSKCYKRKDKLCHPICRNSKSVSFDSRIKDPKVEMCGRHSTTKTSDSYIIHGIEWQDEQNEKKVKK